MDYQGPEILSGHIRIACNSLFDCLFNMDRLALRIGHYRSIIFHRVGRQLHGHHRDLRRMQDSAVQVMSHSHRRQENLQAVLSHGIRQGETK